MSRTPSPSHGSAPHYYPESELEHSHSRSPSTSTVSLSPIPSARSSAFSHTSPAPSSSFVSLAAIRDPDDALLSTASASSVDAEELTRQSLGGSRTASPRLPHSAISPRSALPTPTSSSSLSSSPASPSLPGSSYSPSTPLSVDASLRGLTLSASSPYAVDQTLVDIIARTRLLEQQSALCPPSPSSASPSSPSYEQLAVVYSAGLLQLSQRLQELHHPLTKRLMLSFGAASGQMKSEDYAGCVVTCRRAMECLEGWPALAAMAEKDAMTRLLRSFKASFTSSEALQCRLLYVEFFLTLSALLLPLHAEWAMALQSSAQKGLKAAPQEAVKNMTKVTKLLFTGGLDKPPSAYRSRAAKAHSRQASAAVDRPEPAMDPRAVEVEQAVRMLGVRSPNERESAGVEAEADAAVTEEKRLTAEDVRVICMSLGVTPDLELEERGSDATFEASAIHQRLAKVSAELRPDVADLAR